MVKNPKIDNDEINLIELMYTLWEGKWKIAVAVIISLIAVTSYELTTSKTKNFTAITKIKPISILELNKFLELNNLIRNTNINTNTNTDTNTNTNTNTDTNTNTNTNNNIGDNTSKRVKIEINKITSLRLLNIYINILKDNSVFEDAIRKFNLLEASQYNNEQEYSEAIIRLASSVKIFSSVSDDANLETSYPTINFKYHDDEKWKSVLTHVDEFANKLVKKTRTEEYYNSLLFLINQKKYQLEDISIKINNFLIDYEREMSNHLAYLKEQSAIAKELGIPMNTIEVQTFGNQNALLSNIQTDSPFYLRGYEAIDKEIELIETRKDKKAFISGLFALEKEKRAIEQDQTIARFELALQSTPLSDNSEFTAASINTITTKFIYKDARKIYVIAIVIGLIAGIFYVLISNAFQFFRVYKKN
jgi:LPS O-antigen subunit length determinant protein (WzzB/FepE family)